MPLTLNGTTGIVTGNLADSSVTTPKIALGAVITEDIANGAVTAAKLGTNEQKQICKAFVNFDGTITTTGSNVASGQTLNFYRLIFIILKTILLSTVVYELFFRFRMFAYTSVHNVVHHRKKYSTNNEG
jgi:hypothetical protein